MHMRLWTADGILGSTVALVLTYYILEPDNFASRYAALIGWSTITVFVILMVQGFWSRNRHLDIRGKSQSVPHVSYQLALFKWGGMHSALSIVVTVFLIIHGFLLLSFDPTGRDSGFGRVSLVGHNHSTDDSDQSGSTRASCCVAGLVFVGWHK
jgi:uncharacterized membrane protein